MHTNFVQKSNLKTKWQCGLSHTESHWRGRKEHHTITMHSLGMDAHQESRETGHIAPFFRRPITQSLTSKVPLEKLPSAKPYPEWSKWYSGISPVHPPEQPLEAVRLKASRRCLTALSGTFTEDATLEVLVQLPNLCFQKKKTLQLPPSAFPPEIPAVGQTTTSH